jgi:hypothetical protein
MQLRSQDGRIRHPRPIAPCAQCGQALFAPEWTEYLDDHRVRHLWSCEACDYSFETLVRYPVPGQATAARDRQPFILTLR